MKKTRSRSSGTNREDASNYSIGLVLSGGGIFGAWEAGALRALWAVWAKKHNKEVPPIRVVAGTSAGALTAPFALGRQEHIESIVHWWTSVRKEDISTPNLGLFLPAFAFLLLCDGLGDFGDPEAKGCQLPTEYEDFLKRLLGEQDRNASRKNPLLYGNYKTALQDRCLKTLENCASAWPKNRLGIATIDFGRGQGDVVTNSPADTRSPRGVYESRLYRGIFASAITPLIGYPVLMTQDNVKGPKTPHFDGGVYSEAPFNVLFDLAAIEPVIALTHVIVISAYPFFPGLETPTFPDKPNFEEIGLRFDTLLSEASATKDILLARAALRLRALNETEQTVKSMTGLTIPSPPPILIEAAPENRLGWDNATVDKKGMKELARLGETEAEKIFLNKLPP